MKKSQSSVEFALIVGFLLLVFSSLVVVISNKLIDQQNERNFQAMKDLGEVLKFELDFAGNTVDGYEREVFIPGKLNNLDYEIEIRNSKDIGDAGFSVINLKFEYNKELGDYSTFTYDNIKIIGSIKKSKMNTIVKHGDLVCIGENADYNSCT